MEKDIKFKNIDTSYCGKAFQVEAEKINLNGDVNVQGDLKVNGGSISTPTAADVSYDNTISGLTGDDVQEAVDELAAMRVKVRNFNNLADFANWAVANYATNKILKAFDDSNHVWNCIANNSVLSLYTTYLGGGSLITASISNNGTSTTGYYMIGNETPATAGTTFDNKTYQVYYV